MQDGWVDVIAIASSGSSVAGTAAPNAMSNESSAVPPARW
jgi:hypothetical protein